jgi:adenylate cyclase
MDYSEVTSPTECHIVIAVADIARITQIAQAMSNREMFEMFSEFYELIGGIVESAGGKVVKFMGDAALVIFPGNAPGQAIAGLRRLKAEGEEWLAGYSSDPQINLKAHIGSVVCGPLGPAGEKRFDVIGAPINELFLMHSGDFVLSSELEQALESR